MTSPDTKKAPVAGRRVVAEIRSALGFAWLGNSRVEPGGTDPLAGAYCDLAAGSAVVVGERVPEGLHQTWVGGWTFFGQNDDSETIIG